ncbi:MAG: hypothetical protein A2X94_05930 [Bdellovibrionales bacterium GWB1_55_8]|nr:MAG: hypothetical protein A2X94_05930 [Bdellovibrionales bacterium GWB1_55_8]
MIPFTRFTLLFCALLASLPGWAGEKPGVRFLLPLSALPGSAQTEFTAIIERYNRLHPDGRVQLIRRGDQYSSLRELIAMFLAGDIPEIALIEASEGPAIAHLDIAKPMRLANSVRKDLSPGSSPGGLPSLPFLRTVPVLLANAALLAPQKTPRSWPELENLSRNFRNSRSEQSRKEAPLALPLQGAQGLWMFEAIAGGPLWTREQGGIRSERRLTAAIQKLRGLLDDGLIRTEETSESAMQSFIDQKSLFLATSLDSLSEITRKVSFPVLAGTLFTIENKPALLNGGSDILVTRDTPDIRNFLTHLFSDEVGPKWAAAGNWLPLIKSWKTQAQPVNSTRTLLRTASPNQFRTTDKDVVRARSAWIQSLPLLFGPKAKRLAPEDVFIELDRHLGVR